MAATTRLTTRNLNGLAPDTSIASICSLTFIEPNSAPMLEPIFPAAINAVINGANARMMAIPISDGSHDVAPNSASEGLDCFVKTMPVIKPVNEMSATDL